LALCVAVLASAEDRPATLTDPGTRNVVITRDKKDDLIVKRLPLLAVEYDEIEPFCRDLLSTDGHLGYLQSIHSVVVRDYPANVEKVRAFLAEVDRAPVNVRIEVEFLNAEMSRDLGVDVVLDGDRSGPKIVIENGKIVKPKSVTVSAHQHSGETTRNTRQHVMSVSGRPARLWVGRTIPDPGWLNRHRFCPVGARGRAVRWLAPGEIVWRDVGSALYVMPTAYDDGTVDVEVFPVVTYVDGKGERRTVRVEEVQTRVRVRDGQRVQIGGGDNSTREFMTKLFGPEMFAKGKTSSSLGIYLTPHVLRRKKPDH